MSTNQNEISVVNSIYDLLELIEGDLSREFIHIVLSDIKTFDEKQHDYGPDNIASFGERGVLVRGQDKLSRIKNMIWNTDTFIPINESIDDSWKDSSIYGVIARLCRTRLSP